MAYHTVEPGDTLSAIALRFETTAAMIIQANKYRYPSLETDTRPDAGWMLNVPCVKCPGQWGCCPNP